MLVTTDCNERTPSGIGFMYVTAALCFRWLGFGLAAGLVGMIRRGNLLPVSITVAGSTRHPLRHSCLRQGRPEHEGPLLVLHLRPEQAVTVYLSLYVHEETWSLSGWCPKSTWSPLGLRGAETPIFCLWANPCRILLPFESLRQRRIRLPESRAPRRPGGRAGHSARTLRPVVRPAP